MYCRAPARKKFTNKQLPRQRADSLFDSEGAHTAYAPTPRAVKNNRPTLRTPPKKFSVCRFCQSASAKGSSQMLKVLVQICRGLSEPTRAQRGLYAGRKIMSGNIVGTDKLSPSKTRRVWKPNVNYKRIYSEILDEKIRIHVTSAALRCIDKAGGLDNYILHTKEKDLNSRFGMLLKDRLLAAKREKKKSLLPPSAPANTKASEKKQEKSPSSAVSEAKA